MKKKHFRFKHLLYLFFVLLSLQSVAQEITVKGTIKDPSGSSLPGANVLIEGTTTGVIADIDGNYTIKVLPGAVLVFSFIGYLPEKVTITGQTTVNVALIPDVKTLSEVVVVGYGTQKKETLVGSIAQTTGKVLERAGGVSSLGAALTGNLPGVVSYTSSGTPGAEDPKIIIRTQASWNNSEPLVLVDGVERPMNTIDISSVESISVLKDASATAVFGVKGANGVILITTKRGKEGKANIQIRANTTVKVASKMPEKYDSYDALIIKNSAIERELALEPGGWSSYKPMEIIDKYRNPANSDEWDQYPNVDWQKELFKDYAISHNASANISGGSETVKYFSAIDILNEGDLFKPVENGRGYTAGYGFNRLNVRGNLDFQLTKTTKFSTNLFGSMGERTTPWGADDDNYNIWAAAYRNSPDAFRPRYSDGTWGYHPTREYDIPNSLYILAVSGVEKRATTQINTDFIFTQELDMLLKGLSAKTNFSFDNSFREKERGINDLYNPAQRKYIDPVTGAVSYKEPPNSGTRLDFYESIRWNTQGGKVDSVQTYRKLYYSAQLNYERKFGNHNITMMGLFSREKHGRGSVFPVYREDWVYRATYNYNLKYFVELNGAYNGSEQFGPGYRFAFFPSFSGGWTITEEAFMKPIEFIGMLKLRGSWGRIGVDRLGSDPYSSDLRFLYNDQWIYGGNTVMGSTPANTPYTFYRINTLGNPNISWETSEKRNIALDYSFLNGLISGSVDFFNDRRTDILLKGADRSIPSYFGIAAPKANIGIVKTRGYELELKLNKTIASGIRLWSNFDITRATNNIEFADNPEFKPAYQKTENFPIGQSRSYIDNGFLQSWDDIYGSTARATNDRSKLPGDYNIIDFNADGIINDYDQVPYKYTGVPQNTYNLSLGFEWKGWNLFLQFYGVNNVTRQVAFSTFHSTSNVVFVEGTYWTKEGGGDIPLPHWSSYLGPDAAGTRYNFDGSYVRLKNAEISYTFKNDMVRKIGLTSCRIFVNGSNLWLWTNMPDDRESNFSSNTSASYGAYPTLKRFNMGFDITL